MESRVDDLCFSSAETPGTFVFVIDFCNPGAGEPTASAGKDRHAIVVRVEPEFPLFTLSATELERATRTFAEALAQEIAFLIIEKDFPNGVEPSLSAEQIDHIPAEFENRVPDLCVNGNNAWLVDPRPGNAELSGIRKQSCPGYG